MAEITDPDILKEFETPAATPGAVTDPEVLKLFETEQDKTSPNHEMSTAEDVLRSGGRGMVKGTLGMVGAGGDMREFLTGALRKGASYVTSKETADFLAHHLDEALESGIAGPLLAGPTSAKLEHGVEIAGGKTTRGMLSDKPQTTAGKYAQTVGEFLPTALVGGEGLATEVPQLARGAGAAVLGGLGSESLGELTEGTAFEPAARFIGGLLGGGVSGALERTAQKGLAHAGYAEMPEVGMSKEAEEVLGAYDRLGLSPTVGTKGLGPRGAQLLEANTLPQTVGGGDVIYAAHQKNFERMAEAQQEIAQQFGSPAPSKAAVGEALQQKVLEAWEQAKGSEGAVIGEVGRAFGKDELIKADNTAAAVKDPVGATQPRKIIDPKTGEPVVDKKTKKPVKLTEVSGATTDSEVEFVRSVIKKARGHLTFPELQGLYTRLGNSLKGAHDKPVDEAQVSQLMRAIRKDMEGAVREKSPELAKRWEDARAGYASAMRDFRTTFKQLLGTKKIPVRPEAAYDIFMRSGTQRSGGENLNLFNKVWKSLGPKQQGDIASYTLSRMGVKDEAKIGNLEGWSLGQFLNSYRKLTPQAREMLFHQTGNKQLEQALTDLEKAADTMQNFEKLASSSRSGAGILHMVQYGLPAVQLLSGDFIGFGRDVLAGIVGPYAAAKVMTNPKMVRQIAEHLNQINDAMRQARRGAIAAALAGGALSQANSQ